MSNNLEAAVQAEQQPNNDENVSRSKREVLIWITLSILAVLLVISTVVMILRLTEYVKVDDRIVSLSSNMDETLNVFAMEYQNDSGEVTIKGSDGDKVLAPGAVVDYSIRIRNTDRTAIDFLLAPRVSFLSDIPLPIEVRLIGPGETYIAGSETEWVDMEQLNRIEHLQTLRPNEVVEFVFQWKWPFESGNDDYDTWLGSHAGDTAVGAELAFSIHATANIDANLNGGVFGYRTNEVFYLILIILLLIAAIVLLIVRLCKKLQAPAPEPVAEPEPVFVPMPDAPPALTWGMTDHMNVIRIEEFEPYFEAGETVTLEALKQKGLMNPKANSLKVLAYSGCALQKPLIVETNRISAEARKAILKAGGTVRIIKD